MKLAQALKLPRDAERALIRECWLKLKHPSELPRWPDFWYGDPPRHSRAPDEWKPNLG
jgi:hypothetical protein